MDVFTAFETELDVRPDDIDLYQHVHSTRYIDYVLAARFVQMERDYGMSMTEFAARGLGWYMVSTTVNYKRPLGLGDRMVVRCQITDFSRAGCRLKFEIDRLPDRKRSCDGTCDYALIDLKTNRAVAIPADVREKYSI
ncbi:acyl-CoA thioesterase [Actomonas aquatica]|uniref:Acyl-CoA thioesterase n=1 Tax=Actomonas aquatica TaxID=2866162 RepID=A0ABZ1C2V4_9BACT|nr:acyl-CoA thioesterase [Opitutus sp. WL0086]WRQ85578.1 acyl-CoA thioesterase [Opitutus sp. WL0086]